MSNKTPANKDAKTASAPKIKNKKRLIWGTAALIYLLFIIWLSLHLPKIFINNCHILLTQKKTLDQPRSSLSYARSNPNYNCLFLEIVDKPVELKQGLSGRDNMPSNQGMLFIFPYADKHCFWMKDMKFPLDIVWLDESKTIIHIEKNVQPNTYPADFCPNKPSKYVIEVNSGVANQANWRVGSKVNFPDKKY